MSLRYFFLIEKNKKEFLSQETCIKGLAFWGLGLCCWSDCHSKAELDCSHARQWLEAWAAPWQFSSLRSQPHVCNAGSRSVISLWTSVWSCSERKSALFNQETRTWQSPMPATVVQHSLFWLTFCNQSLFLLSFWSFNFMKYVLVEVAGHMYLSD